MKESEHDEEVFYEQQEHVDELFKQLKEDLKLDDAQATKCLIDWVYVNAEVDYLAIAAERNYADSCELSEFMVAAAQAWLKEQQSRKNASPDAPDQKTRLSAEEILRALDSFTSAIQEIGR